MRAAVITVLAALAAGLADAAETDPLPEDAALLAASTRFALTATNDPAYNDALAAYCRLILKRIEGLPKDHRVTVVDRPSFDRPDFAGGHAFALVGRGFWRDCYAEETHVLDDNPFWFVPNSDWSTTYRYGRGVAVCSYAGTQTMLSAMVGLTVGELEAAATGLGLPSRRQNESEFPPTEGKVRESDLPCQFDVWLPGAVFRQGELIPVYSVLRNPGDVPQRVEWWRNVYDIADELTSEGEKGPDGLPAVALGIYRVEGAKRVRVASRWPWDGCCFYSMILSEIPPKGALVYVMLLNGAYDVSTPGEYEIWAAYPSDTWKGRDKTAAFYGRIPAPPVRFRVVPPWYVTWRPRALIAGAVAVLGFASWVLIRGRRRAGSAPAVPEPQP